MVVSIDFMRGVCVGIDFPGDGIYCALFLGILRVMFMSNEVYNELRDD